MKKSVIASVLLAFALTCCDKDDDNDTNGTDRNFVMRAGIGNTAEVDAGQLAVTKGNTAGIREFGQMMVADHTAAQTQLKSVATNIGFTAPDSLDAEHQALKTHLLSLSGRAFDSVYIHSQVNDHQRTIDLFEDEIDRGDNRQLKDLARSLLPNLRMHLHHADSLSQAY